MQNSKIWKQPVFISGYVDKDVLHIYNGILPSHEGERSPAIRDNMNGLGGH